MIDTKELRRGNYINTPKGIEQVIDVLCDGVNTKSYEGIIPDDIDGVEVTEDILLKCGFISNAYADRYELGKIHVECDKTKGFTDLWIEDAPHIKHLHSLQNYVHARTGKALEINL